MFYDYVDTTDYDQPGVYYPRVGGTGGATFVPFVVTEYKGPTRAPKMEIITTMPYIDSTNFAQGGSALTMGTSELPKISLQGLIYTPMEQVGQQRLSSFIHGDSRITYADFIAMNMEGRGNQSPQIRARVEPLWFRDSYGRRFDDPRVIDFTANYVEGTPGRQTFTMLLQLT